MARLESEFMDAASPMLRRMRDLEEASEFMARDLIKISKGVPDPERFAEECWRGVIAFVPYVRPSDLEPK